jgi:hypothetical protein
MHRLLLAVALLTITLADLSEAQAGTRVRQNRRYYGGGATYDTGGYRTVPQQQPYRVYRGGFFDRLLEFERRKNEFLFGRFRS